MAATKNSARSKKTNKPPQGTWIGGAHKGSIWLGDRKVRFQVVGEDQC